MSITLSGAGGVASDPYANYLLYASMTGADGLQLDSTYTPEKGGQTTDSNQDGLLASNWAIVNASVPEVYPSGFDVWECGVANVDIRCDIFVQYAAGIVFNFVDATHHWCFRGEPGNSIWALRTEDDNVMATFYNVSPVAGNQYAVRVVTNGDNVKCYVNDVEVINYTSGGARSFKAGTKHGIGTYISPGAGGGGNKFKNLTVAAA